MAKKKLSELEIADLLQNADFGNSSDLDELSDDDLEIDRIITLPEDETVLIPPNEEFDDTDDEDNEQPENSDDEDEMEEEGGSKSKKQKLEKIEWVKKNIFRPLGQPVDSYRPDVNEPGEPWDYFSKFLTDELVETMRDKTNIYHFQEKGVSLGVTSKEIETMIGIHVEMGTMSYPQIRLYWTSKRRHPLIANNMTLNRFSKIRNNLHLVDNLEHDTNSPDKYWKVRPIMDKFHERIVLEKPESMLSVDEQMVPFRGKKIPKGLRQYMKGKPTPWGIKFFFLCGVSGFPYDFIPYQGKTTSLPEEFKPYGIGSSVVLCLVTRRIPENSLSSLFTDRFFTSPRLVKKLLDYGVYTTGTVLTNRLGNPPIINNKAMAKKKLSELEIADLLQNADFGNSSDLDELSDDDLENEYINVNCPSNIIYYNKNMGGVDRLDFFVSLYRIYIKSKKWPLRVIFHFIDLFIVTSWFQYIKDCQSFNVPKRKQKTLKLFRLELAEVLILRGYNPLDKSSPGRHALRHTYTQNLPPQVRYDGSGHFPDWRIGSRQRCIVCANDATPKFSYVACEKCNVYLCLNAARNCFRDYHKR